MRFDYCCAACCHRVVLHRILFKSNEVLLGCLLHIRSLCEAASSSTDGLGRGDAAISLVKIDSSVTLTLNEFLGGQQLQREVALKQLTALRDTVVDIVWQACVVSAQDNHCLFLIGGLISGEYVVFCIGSKHHPPHQYVVGHLSFDQSRWH